jgi:Holliday junction resolvase RusA-like endonuclease
METERYGRPHHRYYLSDTAPISLNNAYIPIAGRRWKPTKETGKYKGDFMRNARGQDTLPEYDSFEITYVYFLPQEAMYFGNGNFRKKDVSNYIKLLEDALMVVLGKDDTMVFSLHAYKRVSPDNRFHCIAIVTEGAIDDPIYHGTNPVAFEIDGSRVDTILIPE